MIKVRRRQLPPGWYPASERETLLEIEQLKDKSKDWVDTVNLGIGGILPHAGWYFSGDIAAAVMASLLPVKPELIIVFGGHLPAGETPLITLAESFETPLGPLKNDFLLAGEIKDKFNIPEDIYPDNTVEIQLPLIKYFFGKSKLLALRLPSSKKAPEISDGMLEMVKRKYKKYIILASTDLTHYGPNYDFIPKGAGKKGLDWVKNTNDKGFIDLAVDLKTEELLEYADSSESACSAGAAAGLMTAAKILGAAAGKLLIYKTSYDVMPDPGGSFVGYAGIVY